MEPRRFVEVFSRAAWQAGAVARHLQGEVRNRDKGGESPESAALTAADLATQDVLLERLLEEAPGIAVDTEEETPLALAFQGNGGDALVVIDPIDGTLNYTLGSRDYAVMGSLIVGGRHRAAVVHFPAWSVTVSAIAGGGCVLRRGRGEPEPVRTTSGPDRVLISRESSPGWRDAVAQLGLEACVSRCSAVDSTAPALGRAVAALSEGVPDRRRAVGFLVTTEAGGVVRLGDTLWQGEDTALLDASRGPCIVAASAALADRIAHGLLVGSP